MLPPLNQLGERPSFLGPSRDALQRPTPPSPSPSFRSSSNAARRVSSVKPSRAVSPCEPQALTPNGITAIDAISRIPREFFVVETHAVLPQTQYPPSQYQSTFVVGAGAWETVVFPALTPQTRQQVLYLRQTLEAMRAKAASSACGDQSTTTFAVEYTEKEWALHSVCFHELARQIKCICREQSELLMEIHAAFDASVARLVALVRQLQQQQEEAANERRQREEQAAATAATVAPTQPQEKEVAASPHVCTCGAAQTREPQRPRSHDIDDDEEEEDAEWRSFQRQRRQRMREFASDTKANEEDEDAEAMPNRGRVQRASVVEENTAAARVQQAFAKYQQRKEAQRTLVRMEKRDAAMDIQRSYRGYRERRRTLHQRAVMHTILQRRKQVAAVELLQMNVRAYLIKKRREEKHGTRSATPPPLQVAIEPKKTEVPAPTTETVSPPLPTDNSTASNDGLTELLSGLSELATAFLFLHTRRRKAIKPETPTGDSAPTAEAPAQDAVVDAAVEPSKEEPSAAAEEEAPDELRVAAIRRAEDLLLSFQSVLSELRDADDAPDARLNKATSTTTLPVPDAQPDLFTDALGPAAFLFLGDDDDQQSVVPLSAASSASETETANSASLIDDDEDDDDRNVSALHDALWHAVVYTPRPETANANDDTVRREVLATREQQKRHVALKQLIADTYDTIVGRLRELPRARREKLLRIHASLALSLADGRRLLRPVQGTKSTSEYEPVRAFVGRVDVRALLFEHFQCHVGLKPLVDAAIARVETDVEQFRAIDADVQRFHEYLSRTRSQNDLVFFCLCRLVASEHERRQPVFHDATVRELVDVAGAMLMATRLFYAGGDDASLAETDACVIEPPNEIYASHLPSRGLAQLEVIVRDTLERVDGNVNASAELRATNTNQFHAREYNASAPRSPLRQANSTASTSYVLFTDVVDLLRRYRSVMRHFHAFVWWTYDLFHDAYRHQRQQQLIDPSATAATIGAPLLEETAFVATLLPHSLGASDRELRNVFHNALLQRQLQQLMPVRVFVSVVLVLLRNGLVSVSRYAPLQAVAPTNASHRRHRQEQRWLQLAVQWRAQEQRVTAILEQLQAEPPGDARVPQLRQWRNEFYELLMQRGSLERAETLHERLVDGVNGIGDTSDHDDGGDNRVEIANGPEVVDDAEQATTAYDGAAAAVGSPWDHEPII